ncbi:hypothetical protein LXL04_030113 [Taraxacum kok-saghyz]
MLQGVWNNIAKVEKDIRKLNLNFSNIFNLQQVSNDTGREVWRCCLTANGDYTVEAMRDLVDIEHVAATDPEITWCKEIPFKVLCFVWRVVQGKIPTAQALLSRGVNIQSITCGICGRTENVDHILISCPFAAKIISWIRIWTGVMFVTHQISQYKSSKHNI